LHKLLLNNETTNIRINKHSVAVQAEKTQAILKWIILSLKPFKVVEEKAFHNMVQKLDPLYQIPTRKTIHNLIIEQFNQQRNLVKDYFNEFSNKVALTTDFWTSLKFENFMAITIHFIDNNWKLQHFVLDIFQFKGSHTGKNIADKIYDLLEEFGIKTKTIALTTDNAANMISAANYLQDKLILNNFNHYRCIAHILNLVVFAGLNLLEDSVKKLRKLIKTIRKSTKILEDLEQLAVLNEKTFLVPILDCKTRWNSTYQMIKRACLLYESINMLLIKHPSLNPYMPDIKDWQIYEDLVVLLELFNDATIELSSQTYPTIAHAQIILLALRNDLENKNFLLEEVVEAMLSKFIEYFNRITESLHISAFLDPRYKKLCFPDMTIEEILTPIRQKINQQPSLLVSKKVSSFYQKLKNTSQQAQIMDDEAHKYWLFAEADETIKLLDWWNTHTVEYPALSKLAHNYLCIQASSVPCEQLFQLQVK